MKVDADELAKLLAAATPGPWRQDVDKYEIIGGGEGDPVVTFDMMDVDAAVIVALVNAAPVLVAALRLAQSTGPMRATAYVHEIGRIVCQFCGGAGISVSDIDHKDNCPWAAFLAAEGA